MWGELKSKPLSRCMEFWFFLGADVFFAFPHIAFSEEGEVGELRRPGRTELSHACGALIAIQKLAPAGTPSNTVDPLNIEFSQLKKRLLIDTVIADLLLSLLKRYQPFCSLSRMHWPASREDLLWLRWQMRLWRYISVCCATLYHSTCSLMISCSSGDSWGSWEDNCHFSQHFIGRLCHYHRNSDPFWSSGQSNWHFELTASTYKTPILSFMCCFRLMKSPFRGQDLLTISSHTKCTPLSMELKRR